MSSKNKANKPQDFKPKAKREIATAASWGSKKATGNFELELPSGSIVLLKRVDLPTLLASGAFPDELMSIVSDKIETATGKADTPKEVDPSVVHDMIGDPAKLAKLFDAVDKVLPIVVAQPPVLNHKRPVLDESGVPVSLAATEVIPEEQRVDGFVYTDTVELEDKMFIFQFTVGGTKEVAEFRSELSATVADVPAS